MTSPTTQPEHTLSKEQEERADEFWRSAIKIDGNNGEVPVYRLEKGIWHHK